MIMTIGIFSLGLGVIHLLAGLGLAVTPAGSREWLRVFPRHVWIGRVLAAVALAWSALLVWEMPLGWFDAYKQWLWVGAPVCYLLVVLFLDELLASRALGGLLLLVPAPLLDAARFHESIWRLAPILLAYAWVILGILLVLGPYRFRKWVNVLCATEKRCQWMAWGLLGLGALFVVLALTAFR